MATPYYLEAGTAFEVRAAHNGDSLIFYETDKGTDPATNLLRIASSTTRLAIYDQQYHPWDALTIRFHEAATALQDSVDDVDKLLGGDLNFYSLSADGRRQAIDVRPFEVGTVVPLGLQSNYSGDFLLTADAVAVPEGGRLVLFDSYLGTVTTLQQGVAYPFSI
ncbi:MAG: hypothetical protein EBZ77_17125, partial [Chitinophagia bacterium]|nr:hypothetical protein [Chitinophagia bacterium]